MDSFRYAQFCPLARAAEVLGQRWTLLIIRELFCGPQRFADLKRRLRGVSSSVLTDRLESLEAQGVVARQELGPPAPARLYVLTEHGEALRPILLQLTRWGLPWLLPGVEGDHVEADWVRLAILAFARDHDTPARRYRVEIQGPDSQASACVAGGPEGTRVVGPDEPVDATIRAPVMTVMGLMTGLVRPEDARAEGAELTGDEAALADFALLFEFDLRPLGGVQTEE